MIERLAAALADRYRIERELGAGGMAMVYLADDLRHQRKVALKVMRPELAAVIGAERFLAEITTTANLQHPHILPLFDSGTVDGTVFYVMPFIEGETLRDRLNREKQLPIDVAVRIASEVANALQYAHEHDVIHRDIKPENILLHGGHALVSDFGIALAAATTGASRMTETGMSLGTPTYMSPEQAMGERTLDARTDIYALGCVLYEMLTGDPPYTGSSAQAVVAKIITEKPPSIVAQRDRVPAHVEDAVLAALEKLPADRFSSAGEFEAALAGVASTRTPRRAGLPAARPTRTRMAAIAAMAAVIAIAAASAGWFAGRVTVDPGDASPIQFTTSLGVPGMDPPYMALSPDGRKLLMSATDSAGIQRLAVRDLSSNTLTPIIGTEGGQGGEFSPLGTSIAFVTNSQLRKISLQGGPPFTLVESLAIDQQGLAWTADDDIIFTGRNTGLWRISSEGGVPVQLTKIDPSRGEFAHWSPHILPGGHAMIYTNYALPFERSRIEAFEFKTGRITVLAERAGFARYAPSGQLLFGRDSAIFAIDFDPDRLRTRGTAVPVLGDVVWELTNALAAFDIAPNGTLVYLRASEWAGNRSLVWRDRSGRDDLAIDSTARYSWPRVSPDGRWIAVTLDDARLELWLYDVTRRGFQRLVDSRSAAFAAVWMPDSKRLIYSHEDRAYDLHMTSIDASVPDRTLLTTPFDKYATAISADGRYVVYTEYADRPRVAMANVDGTGTPRMLADTALVHRHATLSPDNRLVAYTESGDSRSDVYLRSLGGEGGRRLVSPGGGMQPRWTRNGREIVYLGVKSMMSATIDPVTGEAGTPTALFSLNGLEQNRLGNPHTYDVTPDGNRFLVVRHNIRPGVQPIVVVLNWRPDMGPTSSAR